MWYNSLITALLRSPLHGLLSGSFMLLTVIGRKTGRAYTTPVNYGRTGDTLTCFSKRDRTWWRNLRERAPVAVLLRGRERRGLGVVVETDEATRAARLRQLYPMMSAAQAARFASEMVMVEIRLEGASAQD
jgi:deazaflavin-dependent oxidoreductase (nitroreductase family)